MTRGIFAREVGEHRVCMVGDYLMERHVLQTESGPSIETKLGGQGNFMNHLLPFQFNIWSSYDSQDWLTAQHDHTFFSKASRWESSPIENFDFPRRVRHHREFTYGTALPTGETWREPVLHLLKKEKREERHPGRDCEAYMEGRKVFDQLESFQSLLGGFGPPESISIVLHEHHGEGSIFATEMEAHWDIEAFYRECLRSDEPGESPTRGSRPSLWLDYRHPEMMAKGTTRAILLEAFKRGFAVNIKSNEAEGPKAIEALKSLFAEPEGEIGGVTLYQTMGAKGCRIIPMRRIALESDIVQQFFVPAPLRGLKQVDNIGAGDTFFAWLLAGEVRLGLEPVAAARLAMIAAGCSVEEAGPFVVFPDTVFRKIANLARNAYDE